MFTGLIEEVGKIENISRTRSQGIIKIKAPGISSRLNKGDSVAVNGTCLTVVRADKNSFQAEVMKETFSLTNIGRLRTGDEVNLERPLRLDGRLDGHYVTGHIDGEGRVKSNRIYKNNRILEIEITEIINKCIVKKGSIAVDGVSLTVISVENNIFTVGLIPYTEKMTTLARKKIGDYINIEFDILGKYVESFLNKKEEQKKNSGLDLLIRGEY